MSYLVLEGEECGGIMSMPLFTIIDYDPKENPWETYKDREVGEYLDLVSHIGDGECKTLGGGVIESIKVCTLRALEDADLKQCIPPMKKRVDLVKVLWNRHPEYRADIKGDTQVGVLTIRPLDYNLGTLNKMVKKVRAVPKVRANRS